MESATLRIWLAEKCCRFDRHEHRERGEGQVMVTVHRHDLPPIAAPRGNYRDAASSY